MKRIQAPKMDYSDKKLNMYSLDRALRQRNSEIREREELSL